jgi:SNF2 family DNA or RNA helicase
MKLPLYKHQEEGLRQSDGKKNFALFGEMGVGKSVMLLADAERSYNRQEIDCLFILAPKGVYRNWEEKEIPTHLSIPHQIFTWSSTLTERQAGKLTDYLFRDSYKLKIVLLNIEALISKRVLKLAMDVVSKYRTMLAVDESTLIKNGKSHRTKVTLELGKDAAFKRILTGSPITKNPYDLYSQALFLDASLLGFPSFLAYKHYYSVIEKGYTKQMVMRYDPELKKSVVVPLTFDKIIEYKNLEHLSNRVKRFSYRVLKKDCLDLPDKVYMTRDVELTPEQTKAYNEMQSMWIMEVEQGSVTASISLVRSLKLHQILCGHVTNDDKVTLEIPSKRVDALMELLEECQDQKIIIFAKYRQDVVNIRKALDDKYGANATVEFHGLVSDKERAISKERIMQDDTCHFFLASKAACRGITLTACTLIVMYSYDYDYEAWAQAEDRVHRIGMTSCTIVRMKAPGTIDDVILASHESKQAIAEQIIDRVKQSSAIS